jgi:hypothetical protein
MKRKLLLLAVMVVSLFAATSYLFLQVSDSQPPKVVPSLSAIAPSTPSEVATAHGIQAGPSKYSQSTTSKKASPVASYPRPEKEPVHHESYVPLYHGQAKATGDNCSDPIIVTLPAQLPYNDLNQYTCGRGNDYDATCLGYYDGGEDIIYRLDVTSTVFVDIVLDPKGTTWTGIALDAACPPGSPCLAYHTNSGGGAHGIYGYTLTPGTYYIMIDTWPTPDCIPHFDLTITEPSGACCNNDPPYDCQLLNEADCNALGYTWKGAGTNCGPPDPCLPTYDIGILSINAPGPVDTICVPRTPQVTLVNLGESPAENFQVFFSIFDSLANPVYTDTALVPSLPSGQTLLVSFRQWNVRVSPGRYHLNATAVWPPDENSSNNILWGETIVIIPLDPLLLEKSVFKHSLPKIRKH